MRVPQSKVAGPKLKQFRDKLNFEPDPPLDPPFQIGLQNVNFPFNYIFWFRPLLFLVKLMPCQRHLTLPYLFLVLKGTGPSEAPLISVPGGFWA